MTKTKSLIPLVDQMKSFDGYCMTCRKQTRHLSGKCSQCDHIKYTDQSIIAFDKAVDQGRLSVDPMADNYAGSYMFMGTHQNQDQFKNILTRAYDV